ncbi:MAG: hypothetical protein Kow0090_15460 [Myxococcota bacterium]
MIYDAKPWLKSYGKEIKPELEIPNVTLLDWFDDVAKEFPDEPAVNFLGVTLTFTQIIEYADRVVSWSSWSWNSARSTGAKAKRMPGKKSSLSQKRDFLTIKSTKSRNSEKNSP